MFKHLMWRTINFNSWTVLSFSWPFSRRPRIYLSLTCGGFWFYRRVQIWLFLFRKSGGALCWTSICHWPTKSFEDNSGPFGWYSLVGFPKEKYTSILYTVHLLEDLSISFPLESFLIHAFWRMRIALFCEITIFSIVSAGYAANISKCQTPLDGFEVLVVCLEGMNRKEREKIKEYERNVVKYRKYRNEKIKK